MSVFASRGRCTLALLALAALTASGGARAGAGVITTVVTPLAANVTYSVPAQAAPARPALNTLIGYTVAIGNAGGNTVNDIQFLGSGSVTDPQESLVIDSVDGASCVIGADQRSLSCAIGQLKAGESAPAFAVFFKAPVADTVSPQPPGLDQVAFAGTTVYAEGYGGPTSPPQNSIAAWAAGAVTLGTSNPTLVKSARAKNGGLIFTGSGGVTTAADPFATAVTIPAAGTIGTAEIAESSGTTDCLNNFSTCFQSSITIPGEFSPYLTIVLRQDASTILKGTKIESVLIQYTGESGTIVVGDCASPTTPRSDGLPCIARRTAYKNRNVPGWTADLDGDFEWILINTRNGSYKVI